MKNNKLIFILFVVLSMLLFFVKPVSHYAGLIALIFGILLSTTNKFYKPKKLNGYRKTILNGSVIFFGFSLNISDVISIGSRGLVVSLISLIIVISFGMLLIKILDFEKITGQLITYGTSICGGSAISAVSGILKPNNQQLAISTAVIFVLNGIALAIFPILGHMLDMTQNQFGVFAALSIHDVSSVVGAASIYGDQALKIATVLKLTRTLWIIPIVIFLSYHYNERDGKLPLPRFILLFIIASIVSSIFNNNVITNLSIIGKVLLPAALFMVGYAIKLDDLKAMGPKGMLFGVSLWFVSIITGITLALTFA